MAGTANLLLSPSDVTNFTMTYTHINTLDGHELFREAYAEGIYQGVKDWIFEGGVQYMEYNILLYQNKSSAVDVPILYAITPFAEITYKINEKKSIRLETQYMSAEHDYGSWAFALLEYNVAPKWSISASDMYNITPNKGSDNANYKNPGNHYYSVILLILKARIAFPGLCEAGRWDELYRWCLPL